MNDDDQPWLAAVREGHFDAIPDPLEWRLSMLLAQLPGNPFRYCKALGLGDPSAVFEARFKEARRSGSWTGNSIELWALVSTSHLRVIAGRGFPHGEDLQTLDGLCVDLRAKLQTIRPEERTILLNLMERGWVRTGEW